MRADYRDLNGTHEIASTIDTLLVDGRHVPVDWPLMPRVSQTGRVAWKAHADGALYLLESMSTVPRRIILPARAINGVTVGNWPLGWANDDTLYVEIDGSGVLCTISPTGRYGDYTPPDLGLGIYSSIGIHHIEPDGRAVMRGLTPALNGLIFGIECWEIDIDPWSPYAVALSNGGGPAGCVVKIHLLTGDAVMWIAPHDIQHPPRIVKRRVAISDPAAPDPDDIDWQKWTGPYVPSHLSPPDTPIVPVPPPPPPPEPTPIDCVWSPWSEWSAWAPLKRFGRQRRTRMRSVAIAPDFGGFGCEGASFESEDRTDPALPAWLRKLVDAWNGGQK